MKLSKNLEKHIKDASDFVGQSEQIALERRCVDLQAKNISPIEQIFIVWIEAFKSAGNGHLKDFCEFLNSIEHQKKIGPYYADFYVERGDRKVVIELDGHAFHDKDEKQRQYEKKRDRYMQKEGYNIFHYTGSEINSDPTGIVSEVFKFIKEGFVEKKEKAIYLTLSDNDAVNDLIKSRELLEATPGDSQVYLRVADGLQYMTLKASSSIACSELLIKKLKKLLGKENVVVG